MFRRRLCKPFVVVMLLFAVAFAIVYGWRWNIDREGRKKLAAVVAKIEAEDPRWRWEDLEADQVPIPDAVNSALLVAEFRKSVGMDRRFEIKGKLLQDSRDYRASAPNHFWTTAAYMEIDSAIVDTDHTWPIIERISQTPQGRFEFGESKEWLKRQQLDEQHTFWMLRFLEWQCERLARDQKPARIELALLAHLNLARLGGTAPLDKWWPRSWELRLVCIRAERMLAMDSLGKRLDLLQAEFAKEAQRDQFQQAIREVRAGYDRLFRAYDSGESSLASNLFELDYNPRVFRNLTPTLMYRPHMAADWAEALDYSTRSLALGNLPAHQRLGALGTLVKPSAGKLHWFANGCATRMFKVLNDSLAEQAYIRCTVAALAVERFRLLTSDWPPSLEAIPKTILPCVPIDPITGTPILFARCADGVTVYAVGPDGVDNGGKIDRQSPSTKRGLDIGFRLYNPDQRRLPALLVPEEDLRDEN